VNLLDLAQKYKLAALAFAVWACWIVSYVVLSVFSDVGTLSGNEAIMGLTAVLGLPAIAAGLIKWRSGRDTDKSTQDQDITYQGRGQ